MDSAEQQTRELVERGTGRGSSPNTKGARITAAASGPTTVCNASASAAKPGCAAAPATPAPPAARRAQQHLAQRAEPVGHELQARLGDHAVEAAIGERQARRVGLHPVQELLRHLVETGSTGLLALSRAAVPTAAREVIGRRLAVLDDDCLRLLTIGAVLGHEFDLAPLVDVAPLPEDAVIAALDEATAAGLLVEPPGPRERFTFTHALVRRALRDRISRAHRRRLHARIADALQQGGAEPRDIAFHLCEAGSAGDVDAAVAFTERAADEAVRALAHGEAVELHTRAMALLPADDPRRGVLALRRVPAYQALTHAVVDQPRR